MDTEVKRKAAAGYPLSNIIFEDTREAILWQNDKFAARFNITRPDDVASLLDQFFSHTEADREGFNDAVNTFVLRIPELARALKLKVQGEQDNARLFHEI